MRYMRILVSAGIKREQYNRLTLTIALTNEVRGRESGMDYLFLLSDTMSPGLRLKIVLRVPVRVEDDDGVGCGEVDAQTSGSRRQQETEVFRVGRVEVVHGLLAEFTLDGAVQSLRQVTVQLGRKVAKVL